MKNLIANYLETLRKATGEMDWSPVEVLAKALYEAVQQGRCVYLCGNGGSAGNAVHLANDFLYGIAMTIFLHINYRLKLKLAIYSLFYLAVAIQQTSFVPWKRPNRKTCKALQF